MEDYGAYLPSKSDIESACRKYQLTWSNWERIQRRNTPTPITRRYAGSEHLDKPDSEERVPKIYSFPLGD